MPWRASGRALLASAVALLAAVSAAVDVRPYMSGASAASGAAGGASGGGAAGGGAGAYPAAHGVRGRGAAPYAVAPETGPGTRDSGAGADARPGADPGAGPGAGADPGAGAGRPAQGPGVAAHALAPFPYGPRPSAGHRAPGADGPRPGPGEAAPRGVPEVAAPGLALASAQRAQALSSAQALAAQAGHVRQRLAAYRRWGLKRPLPAPAAPPVLKPRVRGAKVVSRVPTDDKVIFLTIDDGTVKDPEFLDLVREMDLPVTSFLTDEEARGGAGYDYFRELEHLGGSTHNHTLHHPFLPALPYERQRAEICGQQASIKREFGGPEPRLFRPPFGEYDKDTLRAARACGVDAVVLWGMEAWADRIDFQEPGRRLYPGAIILTHYRGPSEWGGTMADMTRRLLQLAAAQGYSVGRLEDYL